MGTNKIANQPKSEYTYNNGEWSDARYRSFIKGGLRSISQRWPPKYKCLAKAYVGQKTNIKTGRLAKHYECSKCKEHLPQKDVEVNHIVGVVPPTGWDGWDNLISRLFCEADGLEVVCKPCHRSITKEENEKRSKESL